MKEIIKKFIPAFLLSWYHFLLAFLGAVFYGFPSRKIKVIGVTGTNGKTTVVILATKILEEAGYKLASLSSIKFKIGDRERLNTLKMTMPGRFRLQRFLREAVNSGCQYAVLEVTSEGIKQHRHRLIDFDAAVFTNLTPEHIEAHGGFENYRAAKGKLFQTTKRIHILNLDDENTDYFLQFPSEKKIVYTFKKCQKYRALEHGIFVRAGNVQVLPFGLKFSVNNTEFNLKLLGGFNIYNSLAAICVGLSQGVSLETCKKALEKIEGISGRIELVISEPFKVFVDYAFTPAALRKVYETLLKLALYRTEGSGAGSKIPQGKPSASYGAGKNQKSKMICVLGAAGGGRDKWKRPVLGEIAAKYCDEVIVTNEDPYDEDPYQILSMIKSGISKSQFSISNFYEIMDRREAIRKSLELAKPDDIVVITGKGCEPWICMKGGKKIPWDDRKVVKEEFKKLDIPHFLRS